MKAVHARRRQCRHSREGRNPLIWSSIVPHELLDRSRIRAGDRGLAGRPRRPDHPQSLCLVLRARPGGARGARGRPHGAGRRDPGGGRRERFGQEHARVRGDARPRRGGAGHRGLDPVQRRRPDGPRPARAARHPGLAHRHGLPGPADLAQPGVPGRRPDRRGGARAHRASGRAGRGAGARAPGGGQPARSGGSGAALPARALRRTAAAGADRDGLCLQPGAAHHGRAHHGARRDHRGAHPGPGRGSEGAVRLRHPLHHPQPRRGGPVLPPGGGDVRGRDGRRGAGGAGVLLPRPSLHPEPAHLHPAARPLQAGSPPERHRGAVAEPCRAARRLRLRRALRACDRRVPRHRARQRAGRRRTRGHGALSALALAAGVRLRAARARRGACPRRRPRGRPARYRQPGVLLPGAPAHPRVPDGQAAEVRARRRRHRHRARAWAYPVHRRRERLRQDHAGPRRGGAPARFRRRPDVRGQPAGGPRARPRPGASQDACRSSFRTRTPP